MNNEEEDKIENLLEKQTPPSGRNSYEYKINMNLSKKISRLEAKPGTREKSQLAENYVHAQELDARKKRAKQQKRYQEWFDNLEKECYPARDIVYMYNMFFGHELPISYQGFGQLNETKKHFTRKRIKRNRKLITVYSKRKE